jgi:hypothetical protein
MRGDPQVAGARVLPTISRRGWNAWIADVKRRRRRLREEQLEVIARLSAEERRSRRAGEYVRDTASSRRWC